MTNQNFIVELSYLLIHSTQQNCFKLPKNHFIPQLYPTFSAQKPQQKWPSTTSYFCSFLASSPQPNKQKAKFKSKQQLIGPLFWTKTSNPALIFSLSLVDNLLMRTRRAVWANLVRKRSWKRLESAKRVSFWGVLSKLQGRKLCLKVRLFSSF